MTTMYCDNTNASGDKCGCPISVLPSAMFLDEVICPLCHKKNFVQHNAPEGYVKQSVGQGRKRRMITIPVGGKKVLVRL